MNRLLSSMIISMVAFSALSQTKGGKPTLVVGIVIDQLRSDYIELLQQHFSQRGFNHLINDGAYFTNVEFGISQPDAISGTAILFTGSYPNVNGITSSKVFNPKIKFTQDIFTDKSQIGNFTTETYSPKALNVSTIGDELRINSAGLGYVYAIAPDAQQALILGGHAANSVAWINDVTGNWATSTYYKDFPTILQMRNYSNSLSARLDTTVWKPSLDVNDYPDIPTYRKLYPFKYHFKQDSKDRYKSFKQSALINKEVTDVAIDYINTIKLGKRDQLDMLNIAYTTAPYSYSIDRDFRIELQDTYLKLDKQLERLFDAIDKSVGKDNAVIFVSSTGYFDDNRIDDKRFNIPTREFHPLRATSLLNMYLIAIYGNGDWVSGYDNKQIFLNRDLIKERNRDIAEIRNKSAQFLRQMSGVGEAYSLEEILNNPVSEKAQNINRGFNVELSGDIFLDILPGWQIIETGNGQSTVKLVRANAVTTPAFIIAPDVKPKKITSIIDASFLAPTVSRILRIRSPNAAAHKPISL